VRVCRFGTFDDGPFYGRNAAVRLGLERRGFEVVDCRPRRRRWSGWAPQRRSRRSWIGMAMDLARDWLSLARQRRALRDADLVLVPYPPHADVLLVRFLSGRRRKPTVIDAFLGLHDTLVSDRRLVSPGSVLSRLLRGWEARALRAADLVLLDTEAQVRTLGAKYGLDAAKLAAIPVGLDEGLWLPVPYPSRNERFLVAFWGSFIPLHGVDTIARAASLVERREPRIAFRLVGDGQEAPAVEALLNELRPGNLTWTRDLRPIEELQELAAAAACVLGIFGESDKAGAVIPYKVYQGLATGRPVVTRESRAIAEALPDCEALLRVPAGDPRALADALCDLAADPQRCEAMAASARDCYDLHLSQSVLDERLGAALAAVAPALA
ncbi:MAG: glycosyltransferase, partial [Thermoanaerobaculia bacterium]|nr:glycosyltransferase [Thermoanaerobaculia bacterium]